MPMFRFWASESRGSDKPIDGNLERSDCTDAGAPGPSGLLTPVSPRKRCPSFVDTAACDVPDPAPKRLKTELGSDLPSPVSASAHGEQADMLRGQITNLDLEAAREAIEFQFGLEILLKHDELRLVNQELAKCQIALEQLRRCHLVPYPVQCPTPSQMLDISSGRGPALPSRPGQPVPKWAPPFGVVDGPYARHYAKWLIPDPVFDGIQPETVRPAASGRAKGAVEGRATRSSISDAAGPGRHRPVRGMAGQRLHALSSGYPQPKDKHAPCILKRSDGLTVKLVCIDCHRWDFSSTQGFINHCRIAHRRDFKSHEEAAVHCGHPIEVDESGSIVGDDSKPAAAGQSSGLVHPLARAEPLLEHQVYQALLSRLRASLEMYKKGKLPHVSSIPGVLMPKRETPRDGFVSSSDAPYLSRLMQKKKLAGNLEEQVTEAKRKVDWNLLSQGEESETDEPNTTGVAPTPETHPASKTRTPAVMRMPSRAAALPSQPPGAHRAAANKSRAAALHGHAGTESTDTPETPVYDDDMDLDSSPNTMTSNNAPSLVSDDGEYDDSDDGSASETSEPVETESVSDVAEINLDDTSDAAEDTPRPVSRRRGSTSKAAKLKKDEGRHVTFVSPSPVPTSAKNRRRKT